MALIPPIPPAAVNVAAGLPPKPLNTGLLAPEDQGAINAGGGLQGPPPGNPYPAPTLEQVVAPKYLPPPAPATSAAASAAPTWTDVVGQLPGYQNALALQQQGNSQLDDWLKAQRDQAIVTFGDPALASMAGFGLDPQAATFAKQNYLSGNSTLARLNRQNDLAKQAIINRLAAHGILQSGDLGYLQGQQDQNYGNAVYDAQQAVLSQLANLYQSYLQQRQGLAQNVNTTLQQALADYVNNPDAYAGLFGIQPPPAAAPPAGAPAAEPKAFVLPKRRTAGGGGRKAMAA